MSMGGMYLVCRICNERFRVWWYFASRDSGYARFDIDTYETYIRKHLEHDGVMAEGGYLCDPPPFELIGEPELLRRMDDAEPEDDA